MNEIQEINTVRYEGFKERLGKELTKAAEDFVTIGYLLRQARETDILQGSGYDNVNDFAFAEFHLDKSSVSRFININLKFGDPENPEKLLDRYQSFGMAKLEEMLALPDTINEQLSPEFTREEIRVVKEEIREENKITPIEVACEAPEEAKAFKEIDPTGLDACIREIFKENPALYADEFNRYSKDIREIKAILTPDREKMYMIRLKGQGRYVVSFKPEDITTVSVRTEEKNVYGWEDVRDVLDRMREDIMKAAGSLSLNAPNDPGEYFENFFGEKWDVAPAQPKEEPVEDKQTVIEGAEPVKEEKAPVKKEKDKKLIISKETREAKKGKPEPAEEAPKEASEETGQMAAAEELPEENTEEDVKEAAGGSDPVSSMDKNTLRGYKAGLTADYHTIGRMLNEKDYIGIKRKLECMLATVKRILDEERDA